MNQQFVLDCLLKLINVFTVPVTSLGTSLLYNNNTDSMASDAGESTKDD